MEKKELAFYPGVKEEDFKKLPQEYKLAVVNALGDLSKGKFEGQPLRGELKGCKKVYLSSPEDVLKIERARKLGARPTGLDNGGFRMVYRDATIRGKPAIVVVSVGPRDGHKAYNTAERRLKEQEKKAAKKTTPTQGTKKVTPRPSAATAERPAHHRPASNAKRGGQGR